jgi:hypothetical protein
MMMQQSHQSFVPPRGPPVGGYSNEKSAHKMQSYIPGGSQSEDGYSNKPPRSKTYVEDKGGVMNKMMNSSVKHHPV